LGGGDQRIMTADWFSGGLSHQANAAALGIGRDIAWPHGDFTKQVLDRRFEPLLAEPYLNSTATMMLQILVSPTLAIRCAAVP